MKLYLKPTTTIKVNLDIQPNGRIHKFFTEECARRMDRYVPYRPSESGGHLREFKIYGNDEIHYEKPYAQYQWRGMREDGTHVISHWTTPGTGPYWDERMWSAEKDLVIQAVQDELKKSGGK